MSDDASGLAAPPFRRTAAIHHSARHLRLWLSATGVPFGSSAREAFIRAHPDLFGHAYEVTMNGYKRWLIRHHLADATEAFARYIATHHERWLIASGGASALPRCLIASGTAHPCWSQWQAGLSPYLTSPCD